MNPYFDYEYDYEHEHDMSDVVIRNRARARNRKKGYDVSRSMDGLRASVLVPKYNSCHYSQILSMMRKQETVLLHSESRWDIQYKHSLFAFAILFHRIWVMTRIQFWNETNTFFRFNYYQSQLKTVFDVFLDCQRPIAAPALRGQPTVSTAPPQATSP